MSGFFLNRIWQKNESKGYFFFTVIRSVYHDSDDYLSSFILNPGTKLQAASVACQDDGHQPWRVLRSRGKVGSDLFRWGNAHCAPQVTELLHTRPKERIMLFSARITNRLFLTFISEVKAQAHIKCPWKSEQWFIWHRQQVFGLLQQHCSSWETIKQFMPVPLFTALGDPLTQLTCELQSSGNSLTLSRHKKAIVGKSKKVVAEDPRNARGGAVFGWAPLQDSIFPLYNPQVLTLFNNCTKEKETAWRETTEPELGPGDRRKPPPCSATAQFLTTLHRAQSAWPCYPIASKSFSEFPVLGSLAILLLTHLFPLQPR